MKHLNRAGSPGLRTRKDSQEAQEESSQLRKEKRLRFLSSSTNVPSIDIDVVIIGGGIQGLWLLGDLLDKGYQAILLERRRPGFGQTGHSHVFLHEGHMFASGPKEMRQEIVKNAELVREANLLWMSALEDGRLANLKQLKTSFYVGWTNQERAFTFYAACGLANIPCERVTNRPSEFGRLPMIKTFYKSEGICLEAKVLLDHLLDHDALRKRVSYCTEISVETYDSGGFGLAVNSGSKALQVRAGSIVLSAGAGNEKLVNCLFTKTDIRLDATATRQQTVKTFMLVIRDLNGLLKPAAGMFQEFGGIFIVSRQDSQRRTVLLIGDKQRELMPFPGEITAFDATTWFHRLKTPLEDLLPEIVKNADDYEWGIYEGIKAEPWTMSDKLRDGGALPRGYYVHKHLHAPVWLTWPTLLTFAPMVASHIVQEVDAVMKTKAPAWLLTDWGLWESFCVSLTAIEDRWKTTQLLCWKDFERCFASS